MDKNIIYDVEWQKLRIKIKGNLSTEEGLVNSIQLLREYLAQRKPSIEEWLRVKRVLNLLNATRMGFHGQNLQNTKVDDLLVQYREEVRTKYKRNLSLNIHLEWDFARIKKDLVKLYSEDIKVFEAIQKDLQLRADKTMQKRGSVDTRPELIKFLSMMKEVSQKGVTT